jgi:basic membrane protein A and related proteins
MKKIVFYLVVFSLAGGLFGFSNKEAQIDPGKKPIVGLILNEIGLGDKLSNDSCYLGLEKAEFLGEIHLITRKISEEKKYTQLADELIADGASYIYSIGEEYETEILVAAKKYPEKFFIGVDVIFPEEKILDNITGISFYEQEGGYLAGLVAGSLTYKFSDSYEKFNNINRVGVILGKSTPWNKRYELGFYKGVYDVNPFSEVITVDINDENSYEKGFEAVRTLYNSGVDIIFSVAGKSDAGVFAAAEELGVLIIGSNKDRSSESPSVLTSIIKDLSISSYLTSNKLVTTEFTGGENTFFGLKEGAISLSSFNSYEKYIPRDLRETIRKNIRKIKIADFPESVELIVFEKEKIEEEKKTPVPITQTPNKEVSSDVPPVDLRG